MKKAVFLILLTVFFALCFRIPFWKDLPPRVKQENLERAETMVRENLAKKLAIDMNLPPSVPEAEKNELVEQKVRQTIESNPAQYDTAVALLQEQLDDGLLSRYSKKYLPCADPYYYLSLTDNILKKGEPGPSGHNGTFFNPMRRAPAGSWDRATWHPYVGVWVYRLLRAFDGNIPLSRAVAYVPLLLTVFFAISAYLFFASLGVRPLWAWMGSLIFLLSPIAIFRSRYGWYDTDPYILIFSTLITGSLLLAVRTPQRSIAYGIGGGLLTGFFTLFWQGWLYIVPLVVTGSSALILFEYLKKEKTKKDPIRYLIAYGLTSLLSALILISPKSLGWAALSGLSFFPKAGGGAGEQWPDLMPLIGEAGQVSAKEWSFLTLSYGALIFSILGLAAGVHFFRTKNDFRLRQWLIAVSIGIPLMVLSMHARRFTLFVVMPMALLAVLGMEWSVYFLKDKILPRIVKTHHSRWAIAMVMLCVLPATFLNASAASQQSGVIMTDQWFKVLNHLRTETPKDAVVFSWWTPGYFINGVAERRSVVDGGTQHRPENFWIAKAFMSHDENQAVGIFRMLAASGNEALEYLKKLGMDTDNAVDLILKIVSMDRKSARSALPAGWSDRDKENLLKLTHDKSVPSRSYLLVFDDLVSSNVILQQVNRWNFKKAEKVFNLKQSASRQWQWGDDQAVRYFRKVNVIVGELVPYEKPKPAIHAEKNFLFYDDLIIDRVKKEAMRPKKDRTGIEMKPVSLLYREGENWVAKPVSDSPSAVWAVVFETEDPNTGRKAMLVRKELLGTLLFQLYYLKGYRYRWIKPVTAEGSLDDVDYILAFQIDFSAFDRRTGAGPS